MIDAEWYIHNVDGLLNFCHQKIIEHNSGNGIKNAYLVRIMSSDRNIDFYTSRLIKSNSKTCFVGRVHEAINYVSNEKVFEDVYFEWSPSKKGCEASVKRYERDLSILLEDYNTDPSNPRTVFYLAQTYECLGDLKNAYKYYKIRAKMDGWDEENFITVYRLAQITQMRCDSCRNKKDFFCAFKYYSRAHFMRPTRAEPLIRIAEHYYSKNNMPLCYLFAKAACEIPYPKDDILFVEKNAYDFLRYHLLNICSCYTKRLAIGKDAAFKLEADPNNNLLIKNLEFYKAVS